MPDPPYIPGSDTSKDAADNLKTRLLVADGWIVLMDRPDGTMVREVERHTGVFNSGPSVRQGELVKAGVSMRAIPKRSRERCGVYVLVPGITVAEAKERYRQWVKTDEAKPKKGKKRQKKTLVPASVAEMCGDVAEALMNTDDEALIGSAMQRLRDAIRQEMCDQTGLD